MGMYTELHYNVKLKQDIQEEILISLRYMLGITGDEARPLNDPFDGQRWMHMLRCDSYYFDADTHSTLRFDTISEQWYLCIRCNFKNYDNELDKFLSWIRPYIEAFEGDFLGFSRYEESQMPDLIFA